ncbi:MAG: amino acid adenylation domain-containing protein [Polyangiaceae bacterium]
MSWGQKAIWFLQQLNPDSFAYNVAGAIEMLADIDVEVMFEAMRHFILRHPALRASFVLRDNQPVQSISPTVREDFEFIDVQGLSQDSVNSLIVEMARKNFNLENDPLLRLRLLKCGAESYILAVTVHHIVSDAISNYLTLGDVFQAYRSIKSGSKPNLPALNATYLDFVNWQAKLLGSEKGDRMLDFWKESLSGELPVLNLQTDRQRPLVQTNHGDSFFFEIDPETTAAVNQLSRDTNATLFMVLISTFYVLLHEYSGQEDIIIGTPVSGRTQEEFSNVYGYFVNPLPLRLRFEKQTKYSELLQQVQSLVMNALDNLEYPFGLLIEKLGLERDASRSAIFQVMFNLLVHQPPSEENGIPIKYIELPEEEGQFDITLSVFESVETHTIQAVFKYNTDLFDRSTIKRMADHYVALLKDILKAPTRRVAECDMMTDEEKQNILGSWRGVVNFGAEDALVHQLIERRAKEAPAAIAVAAPSDSGDTAYYSYEHVNAKANQLARYLRKLGVVRGEIVGIRMRKSCEMIVAVLAIIKSGGAYVPLDPDLPKDRASYILENSEVKWLLCDDVSDSEIPAGAKLVDLTSLTRQLDEQDDGNLQNVNQPSDKAYVIYTSGSTGKPKGVAISHGNWLSMYQSYESAYCLRDGVSSHLQMANFSFDVFSGDFVRALCSGGKLVLCRKEVTLNVPMLYDVMQREQVKFAEFVPAVIRGVMRYLETTKKDLSFMKVVVVSSDVWTVAEYKRLKTLSGKGTRVINTYGLTEATIDSTYFEGNANPFNDTAIVPIAGRPFANTTLYILDEFLKPVGIGVPGELCIGGDGVAMGYVKDEELNQRSFVNAQLNGESIRLFRTRDTAKWDDNGLIHLLGRSDQQVKVRGFRIELREIEAHLKNHPDVQDAAVTVGKGSDGENCLYAYYVSKDANRIERRILRDYLAERVPHYMVPYSFTHVLRVPISSNGKVNTRALPAPDVETLDSGVDQPTTIFEKGVASVWSRLLNVEGIGTSDDFFALGGTSIKLVELLISLQNEFGVVLSVGQLFKHSTLEAMANVVRDAVLGGTQEQKPYVVFNPKRENAIYCFPPAGGYGIVYRALAERLHDYSLVSFSYITGNDKISRYADLITEHDTKGPYLLLGYSLGGNLAFEVGKELERRGHAVKDIVVLDAYRVRERFKFNEADVKMFEEELGQHLKKHIGSEVVETYTLQMAKDYIEFSRNHVSTGEVKARVSLMVDDSIQIEGLSQYGVSKEESWRKSSQTETIVVKGFGRHEDMLDEQHVHLNADVIRRNHRELRQSGQGQRAGGAAMTERKTIIVVGAGLAGMAAGCYGGNERISNQDLRHALHTRRKLHRLETEGLPFQSVYRVDVGNG